MCTSCLSGSTIFTYYPRAHHTRPLTMYFKQLDARQVGKERFGDFKWDGSEHEEVDFSRIPREQGARVVACSPGTPGEEHLPEWRTLLNAYPKEIVIDVGANEGRVASRVVAQ